MRTHTRPLPTPRTSHTQKFDFYHERFLNHMRSLEIADKQRVAAEVKRQALIDDGEHTAATQFLIQAVDTVRRSRRVLAWTYAYALFLTDDSKRTLFQFQQGELEAYTEALSALCDKGDAGDLDIVIESRSEIQERNAALQIVSRAPRAAVLVCLCACVCVVVPRSCARVLTPSAPMLWRQRL